MTAVGGSVKLPLFVLVSLLICSSLGNQLKQTCKNGRPACGNCCNFAFYKCSYLCPKCPKFGSYDPCYLHEDNSNYMKFFKSKRCPSLCNMKRGRELQSDDPYVSQGNTLSALPHQSVENREEITTF